jgi:hypothetical protein
MISLGSKGAVYLWLGRFRVHRDISLWYSSGQIITVRSGGLEELSALCLPRLGRSARVSLVTAHVLGAPPSGQGSRGTTT